MERLGVPALSRASPYLYNTEVEIDQLFTSLGKAEKVFAR
jgi:selenocysteine lyase/cysteine desulfurase